MKYYVLSAVVRGKEPNLKQRLFSSRDDAIKYMFDYFEKNYIYNAQVNDEYYVNDDKHNIEYVCDYYTRFTINRVDRSLAH